MKSPRKSGSPPVTCHVLFGFVVSELLVWIVIIIGTFGAVAALSVSSAALGYGVVVLVIRSLSCLKKSFFPMANPIPHEAHKRSMPDNQTDHER